MMNSKKNSGSSFLSLAELEVPPRSSPGSFRLLFFFAVFLILFHLLIYHSIDYNNSPPDHAHHIDKRLKSLWVDFTALEKKQVSNKELSIFLKEKYPEVISVSYSKKDSPIKLHRIYRSNLGCEIEEIVVKPPPEEELSDEIDWNFSMCFPPLMESHSPTISVNSFKNLYFLFTVNFVFILLLLIFFLNKTKNKNLQIHFLTLANHRMMVLLNESENRFQEIKKTVAEFEMGFDKFALKMTVNTQWTLLNINNNFCRFLGLEKTFILNKRVDFFLQGLSENATVEAIERGLMHGNSWRGEVHLFSNGEQTDRWAIFTIIPFVNETGALYQFVIIGFDVTEKRLSENKLKILSTFDELTDLPNRRSFDQVMEREWLRMKRQKSYMSVIMIDVDFFKKYNDFYGHVGGDDCLKRVAYALHQTIKRSGDLIARFGGEEFAVILPNTDVNGALEVAEKLRWSVLQLKIPHAKSEIERYVTISAGVSTTIPGQGNSITLLIETADEALYWAKSQGRNTSRIKIVPGDVV